jgi:fucose permease
MLIPLACYVFVAYYAFVGSRMKSAAQKLQEAK